MLALALVCKVCATWLPLLHYSASTGLIIEAVSLAILSTGTSVLAGAFLKPFLVMCAVGGAEQALEASRDQARERFENSNPLYCPYAGPYEWSIGLRQAENSGFGQPVSPYGAKRIQVQHLSQRRIACMNKLLA